MPMKHIDIDELKQIQFDILVAVHDFCVEHDLKYTLAFGTLLGAVRHKGYIPWDDDIDIAMCRKDYDFFVSHFNGTSDFYKVYDIRTDEDYVYGFAKVADTRTVLVENVTKEVFVLT